MKDAIAANDTDRIKAATEDLKQAFYKISEKIYKQNPGAQGGPQDGFQGGPQDGGYNGGNNGGANGPDGNVYEGDFKDANN